MRKFVLILFITIPLLMSKAQVVRWVMSPVYNRIYIAEGVPLIIGDSANVTSINDLEGRRIGVTYDQLHPFAEGFSVTTDYMADAITGFYDGKGQFVRLSGCTVAYDYPYFCDGRLLVKKGNKYCFINTYGEDVSCSQFTKVYPFSNGRAVCMAYESMEKQKNPYYVHITSDNTPQYSILQFTYNGKILDKMDFQFLSSLNDEGMGIAVFKNRIYWVTAENTILTPVLTTLTETNTKKQLSVVGEKEQYIKEKGGTYVLRGKSGKTDFVEFYFDNLMRLKKICYADGIEEVYEENTAILTEYQSSLSAQKINGKWNLQSVDKEILPPQFDEYGFAVGNYVVVRLGDKWGMLVYDETLKYSFELNGGNGIGFRHRDYDTSVRLDLPPIMNADRCRFDFADSLGCKVDRVSLKTTNTEFVNCIEYECRVIIPKEIHDTPTMISYPMQITYDGLKYPISHIQIEAWHYKYLNVKIDKSETFVTNGNMTFTFVIDKDRGGDKMDYPFEVSIYAADSLSPQKVKISETIFQGKLTNLSKGVNEIFILVEEKGCPPYIFPFEITYMPPVVADVTGEVIKNEDFNFEKKELHKEHNTISKSKKEFLIPMDEFLQ